MRGIKPTPGGRKTGAVQRTRAGIANQVAPAESRGAKLARNAGAVGLGLSPPPSLSHVYIADVGGGCFMVGLAPAGLWRGGVEMFDAFTTRDRYWCPCN